MKGTRKLKYYKGIEQLFNSQESATEKERVEDKQRKGKMADTNLIRNYLKGRQITCSTPATELAARTKEHEHTHAAHQQDSRVGGGESGGGRRMCPASDRRRAHTARDRREADAVTEAEQAVLRDRRPGPQEEVPDMHIHALSNQALERTEQKLTRGRDRWLQWLELSIPTFNTESNSWGKGQQEKKV